MELPQLPRRPTGWIFNPFAWQFLFSLGAVSAALASQGRPGSAIATLFWVATAYVLFALLVAAPWTRLPGLAEASLLPDFRTAISKQDLSLWRVAHIVALAYLVASLFRTTRDGSLDHGPVGRDLRPPFTARLLLRHRPVRWSVLSSMVEVGSRIGNAVIVNASSVLPLGICSMETSSAETGQGSCRLMPRAAARP